MTTPTSPWSELIGVLVLTKQQIVALDPDSPLTYRLPRPGTSVQRVDAAGGLDPSHRTLLLAADGWPDLNLGLQLLSVDELSTGPLHDMAASRLELYLGQPLEGWREEDVYSVAVSDDDRDLVVVGRPGSAVAGRVAWLDGGVVATYPHLEEWFRTVVELHLQELRRLQDAVGSTTERGTAT